MPNDPIPPSTQQLEARIVELEKRLSLAPTAEERDALAQKVDLLEKKLIEQKASPTPPALPDPDPEDVDFFIV